MGGTLFVGTLYLVFFLSGFAALIYQVVWQRAFTLYYGVGAISTSIVVSVFLFGLGVGAYAGGRLAERLGRWRVTTYVVVEGALAIMGALSMNVLAAVTPALSRASYAEGFAIIAALIALPTILMGMTLPMMVKITNVVNHNFGVTLARLYAVNTLGAAIGALVGAYWLISFHGLRTAVIVAGAVNAAIAVAVLIAARLSQPGEVIATPAVAPTAAAAFSPRLAAGIVLATGFLAIGYQMVWFRIIGTLLKPSAYVFSTVLAIYLIGIAFGSWAMARWLRRHAAGRDLASVFFLMNALIPIYVMLTMAIFYTWGQLSWPHWMVTTSFAQQLHPPYFLRAAIANASTAGWKSLYLLVDLLIWPTLLMLPATILMGAGFPLMNVLVLRDANREGQGTGLIYALTVAGNVTGGLLTGFYLMPLLSTETTLMMFVAAGLLWLLGVRVWRGRPVSFAVRAGMTIAALAVALAIMPGRHQFFDSIHPRLQEVRRIVTEGRDGVVVTMAGWDRNTGREFVRVFIGGSDHATYPSAAYEVEALETLTHAHAVDRVLVIGFGGGNITAAMLRNPEVKSVTVVEIADTLIDNLRQLPIYGPVFTDPRLTLVIDDGRRYLQREAAQYDMVFMDPLQSTAAYSNNLYSREFFELVKQRLAPGGVLMTWMNEYMIVPRTLATVFEDMKCFYYFCVSSNQPLAYDTARRQRFLSQVDGSMRAIMAERMDVPYYLTGDRAFMLELTKRFPLNTDMEPITEYYIGYLNRGF